MRKENISRIDILLSAALDSMQGRREQLFYRVANRCMVDWHGCWVWQGGDSGSGRGGGYGRISVDGQMMAVHRVMYMIKFGPLHSNRHVDHTCGNRLCCNPAHLEAVTHKENCKRRDRRSGGVS